MRRIVEKMGGQVGIESQAGQGSIFSFTLPAAEDDDVQQSMARCLEGPLSLQSESSLAESLAFQQTAQDQNGDEPAGRIKADHEKDQSSMRRSSR